MIMLKIDTKKCMSELLLRETFDSFSFIEGEITTFSKFTIDGFLHKSFFEEAPEKDYANWKELREYCFSIIKGKRTPLDFKLIFSLPQDKIAALIQDKSLDFQPENVQGLYLNFRYDGFHLTCTTGTSLKTFTLYKSLEQAWDKWIQDFFTEKEIKWDINN